MKGKIIKVQCGCDMPHNHKFKEIKYEEVVIKFDTKVSDPRQINTIPLENSLYREIRKFQTKVKKSLKKQIGSDPIKNINSVNIDSNPLGKILFNNLLEAYKLGKERAEADVKLKVSRMAVGDIDTEALMALEAYSFIEAKAFTEAQTQGLKYSVADGIRNGKGTKEIARQLRPQLEDLHTYVQPSFDSKGNLERAGYIRVISAKVRAEMMARTETIGATNLGRLNTYAQNSITKVEGVVAGDERTCPICMDLIDGRIYTINEAKGIIPVHPNCRCTWVITEGGS